MSPSDINYARFEDTSSQTVKKKPRKKPENVVHHTGESPVFNVGIVRQGSLAFPYRAWYPLITKDAANTMETCTEWLKKLLAAGGFVIYFAKK